MKLTYDDVQQFDLSITHRFERDKVEQLVSYANAAFPDDSRFGGKASTAQRGRILYVMHMLEQPGVNVNASWIRRQMSQPRPGGRKAHPWDSTAHGRMLKEMVIGATKTAVKATGRARSRVN